MNSWCFDILESNNIPGNYAFLAEAGIYYLKFHKPGYKIEYQMIKVQKDCSFDFNMTISKSVKLSFMLIDVLNFSIIPDVDISVYDQGGHLMDSGASNGLGQFESKTELGALIKVLCKNTGYVTLYQEYLVTTTAILDKIYIGMIPMSEEASSLDVLAVYPKDTFTVSLHAICPGIIYSSFQMSRKLYCKL